MCLSQGKRGSILQHTICYEIFVKKHLKLMKLDNKYILNGAKLRLVCLLLLTIGIDDWYQYLLNKPLLNISILTIVAFRLVSVGFVTSQTACLDLLDIAWVTFVMSSLHIVTSLHIRSQEFNYDYEYRHRRKGREGRGGVGGDCVGILQTTLFHICHQNTIYNLNWTHEDSRMKSIFYIRHQIFTPDCQKMTSVKIISFYRKFCA